MRHFTQEIIHIFSEVRVTQSLVFCVVFLSTIVYSYSFEHCIAWPTFFLRFKASYFLFGILKLFFQWMDGWFSLGPPVSFAHHILPLKKYKQTNETKMNGGHDVTGMRSYMSFNTIMYNIRNEHLPQKRFQFSHCELSILCVATFQQHLHMVYLSLS